MVMFPVQPDDITDFRPVPGQETGIPHRAPYPLKQPGINVVPYTVVDPPSPFFGIYEPGLVENAHMAGDGRRSEPQKVSHIADAELFRVHKRQESPEPVLFAECFCDGKN
ncbi:hypothetical protein SDC9_133646 [bioreactor metagenome]|uniref:Uncharacterized protein n=1 Tax=bioreactor metagenome TaxID=1076179 RepID=A0A645DBI5_9ZZZZ